MPELPEVEAAARVARRAVLGRVIAGVRILHAAQRRALPARVARTLVGDRITHVRRRGKYQLLCLASGRTLVVHFRMTGDWHVARSSTETPPHARVVLAFADKTALMLVDPRALGTVVLVPDGEAPLPALGPDATSRAFTPTVLAGQCSTRTTTIKALLLDQRVVAGVGNIYACEALWRARLDPRRQCRTLSRREIARLVTAIQGVMHDALAAPTRYANGSTPPGRFDVYDREGEPCRRCRATIARIPQGQRSTYCCAACQH